MGRRRRGRIRAIEPRVAPPAAPEGAAAIGEPPTEATEQMMPEPDAVRFPPELAQMPVFVLEAPRAPGVPAAALHDVLDAVEDDAPRAGASDLAANRAEDRAPEADAIAEDARPPARFALVAEDALAGEEPASSPGSALTEPAESAAPGESAAPDAAAEEAPAPPPPEDGRLARARELEQQGDVEGAIALYREVLQDLPNHLKARNNLGVLFDRRGEYALALEQYEAARATDPDNVEVLLNLGAVLGALGRFEQAERELRRAQRLDPERADVHANLGILCFKRGLYAQADLELKRAIELAPDHAAAYFYRGEALNILGRVDEALGMLERASQLQPRNPKAYYTMGILYDKKNLRQQAQAMYRKAREVGRP